MCSKPNIRIVRNQIRAQDSFGVIFLLKVVYLMKGKQTNFCLKYYNFRNNNWRDSEAHATKWSRGLVGKYLYTTVNGIFMFILVAVFFVWEMLICIVRCFVSVNDWTIIQSDYNS